MANLKFLSNVTHNGIRFVTGSIIDLETDTRGLRSVLKSLEDRGLVEGTEDQPTHSSNLVNGAQEAQPLGQQGTAPVADNVKAQQEAFKDRLRSAAPVTQGQVQQNTPAPQNPPAPAPVPASDPQNAQPTEEEIAAAVAAVK